MVTVRRALVSVLLLSLAFCPINAFSKAKVLTPEELAPLVTRKGLFKRQSIHNVLQGIQIGNPSEFVVDLGGEESEAEHVTRKSETPVATPWPTEFTIAFTTKNGTALGLLAYDWGNKQQVIMHGPGSTYCLERDTEGSCYILENPVGSYGITPSECVLEGPGVGSVPPTWTVQGVFSDTEEVNGVLCNRFKYPPTMHEYLETVDGGVPCAFTFPDPSKTYVFSPVSLTLEIPNAEYFKLPDYCPTELTLKSWVASACRGRYPANSRLYIHFANATKTQAFSCFIDSWDSAFGSVTASKWFTFQKIIEVGSGIGEGHTGVACLWTVVWEEHGRCE